MSTVQIDATVGCSKILDANLVGGGTHRDRSSKEGTTSLVLTVTIEPKKEDGWEAEAFWTLLADARYTTWETARWLPTGVQ